MASRQISKNSKYVRKTSHLITSNDPKCFTGKSTGSRKLTGHSTHNKPTSYSTLKIFFWRIAYKVQLKTDLKLFNLQIGHHRKMNRPNEASSAWNCLLLKISFQMNWQLIQIWINNSSATERLVGSLGILLCSSKNPIQLGVTYNYLKLYISISLLQVFSFQLYRKFHAQMMVKTWLMVQLLWLKLIFVWI